MYKLQNKKIWVAGHNGMVGAAIMRQLRKMDCEILTASRSVLDLRNQPEVREWIDAHKPDAVFLAAAKVGGILANRDYPAEFIHDNLAIQNNVIHESYRTGVEKLLFLGSSCIYPKNAPQPISEDALLSAPLEPTNETYAIAKIAGLKMCEAYNRQYGTNFIAVMPCNLYGPQDRYDQHNSHVIPALIMKMHEAKQNAYDSIQLWGTGTPLREFLYVDDLAEGLICAMEQYEENRLLNIGSGEEISIAALADKIAAVTGYTGGIEFDPDKPDGPLRKCLDNSRIDALGWQPRTALDDGLTKAYEWYCNQYDRQQAA